MSTSLPVETSDFRIDIDDCGIAHLVFQPAGGMPVTGVQGQAELARVWARLAEHPDVRVILVRSEGWFPSKRANA